MKAFYSVKLNYLSGLAIGLVLMITFGFTLLHNDTKHVKQPQAVTANTLKGAWRLLKTTEAERTAPNVIKIVVDGYFTVADYNLSSKEFIGAQGGTFVVDKGRYTEKLEYYTQDSTRVGSTIVYNVSTKGKRLQLTGTKNGKQVTETWERVDAGETASAGAWRIRERETQPGQMTAMPRGARKTIKWLSGSRFQWAAINPETKQFFGTGGGTYTLQNGKYTEQIEFFSRDSKRVGMSVSFEHELKNGDWHHRGLSTAGNKIYEVWAKEK